MNSTDKVKQMTSLLNKKLDILEIELFKDWNPRKRKNLNLLICDRFKRLNDAFISAADAFIAFAKVADLQKGDK